MNKVELTEKQKARLKAALFDFEPDNKEIKRLEDDAVLEYGILPVDTKSTRVAEVHYFNTQLEMANAIQFILDNSKTIMVDNAYINHRTTQIRLYNKKSESIQRKEKKLLKEAKVKMYLDRLEKEKQAFISGFLDEAHMELVEAESIRVEQARTIQKEQLLQSLDM